jgi:hypothetical protein
MTLRNAPFVHIILAALALQVYGFWDNRMTVAEVYNSAIKPLPMGDRLKLAAMILNDMSPQAVVEYQDAWSDDDLREFSTTTWKQSPADSDGEGDAQGG